MTLLLLPQMFKQLFLFVWHLRSSTGSSLPLSHNHHLRFCKHGVSTTPLCWDTPGIQSMHWEVVVLVAVGLTTWALLLLRGLFEGWPLLLKERANYLWFGVLFSSFKHTFFVMEQSPPFGFSSCTWFNSLWNLSPSMPHFTQARFPSLTPSRDLTFSSFGFLFSFCYMVPLLALTFVNFRV